MKIIYKKNEKDTTLIDICFNNRYNTDKYTGHTYIQETYNDLFCFRKDNIKKILEVGINTGGSILLWRDYFQNANIYGIDIRRCDFLNNKNRITQIIKNAYCKKNG